MNYKHLLMPAAMIALGIIAARFVHKLIPSLPGGGTTTVAPTAG